MYLGAYFHSKTVCVDSTLCSIGSANLDIRSSSINYETNLVVYAGPHPRIGGRLHRSGTAWRSRQPSTRGAGGPRGRLFLPTETPDDLGYFTRPVDILEDAGGGRLTWTWREWSGPAYVPRACQ